MPTHHREEIVRQDIAFLTRCRTAAAILSCSRYSKTQSRHLAVGASPDYG